MKLKSLALAAAVAALAVTRLASANALITNGSFESNTGNGQLGFNTSVTGWSVPAPNGSYTFLYGAGTADTVGADGEYGNVGLWGPNNGSNNGLPATSPDGGYYLANDGDFQQGAISQTVSGLTVGANYTISFD